MMSLLINERKRNMNKTEFIKKVKDNAKAELSAKNTEDVVNAVFDTITDVLASGDSVKIIGFGTFEVRERAARTGVNPRDPSKKIQIEATRTPAFKAGKNFKDAIKEN